MTQLSAGVIAAGMDALPAEVAILDAAGEIILVNEAWRQFADANHGTSPDYWLGSNYLEIAGQAYDDPRASEIVDGLRAILDGTETQLQAEYPCHSPTEQRWFMMQAAGFRQNGAQYVLVAHLNITDRKEAELQATTQREQLETLLGVLTHDIRNPLNVIGGYAALLATELGENDKVDTIQRAAQRITEITEATLAFTRSGALSTVEPVDTGALAREAWRTVDTADATLTVRDAQTVLGDRRLLLQLFENLFRNAIQHAGEACTVTVGTLTTGFYVEDDGEGLPEAIRAKIVDADFSTKGTNGLGLAIVQAVAHAHGAEFLVTDTAGGGARFEFTGFDIPPK
ncbi:sensor histidine kinase [Haloplanus halobius]|uniref:sensor histidine kinase n=1 Tax=Haloplanus halobius TaxID=2934938 RepID=UPI00200E7F51|nr:PAS domain-containing sensor histidine kinase [Haloplanus sp. XH21]